MKILIAIIVFNLVHAPAIAQFLQNETKDTSVVYTFVEKMPEFPGGENELFAYLSRNIVYPKEAKDAGVTGTVYITFVVEKDGKITESKILRDVKVGDGFTIGLGEEALRVISAMPDWVPGSQQGSPVRVQCNLPIKFSLKNKDD